MHSLRLQKHKFAPVLFALMPWQLFLANQNTPLVDAEVVHVSLGKSCNSPEKHFQAVLAIKPESREKGLGLRKAPLAPNEAMLFIFSEPTVPEFWMKNTYIPLSLGFFGTKSELINIYNLVPEKDPTNPKATYKALGLTSIALEAAPHALDKLKPKNTVLCLERIGK